MGRERRRRIGPRALAAAALVTGLAVSLVGVPAASAGDDPEPTVATVTITLVVVGTPPPDAVMAYFWACDFDTDFTTFPNTGGSTAFDLTAGGSCRFAVRDEPGVPSALFLADIQTATDSPDLTFSPLPGGVEFAASDTATGNPVAQGTVTITADFTPAPPPVAPPATPAPGAPSFTG